MSVRKEMSLLLAALLIAPAQIGIESSFCLAQKTKTITSESIEKELKNNPHSYEVRIKAAHYLENMGCLGQAEEQYQAAGQCPNAQAEAFLRLAQMRLQQRQYKKAQEAADLGVKKFPNNYGTQLTAGYVYHNLSSLDVALSAYQKAQKLQPKNPEIYIALADVYLARNEYEKALNQLEQCAKLNPPQLLYRYQKGKVLQKLGRLTEARDILEKNYREKPFESKSSLLYLEVLETSKLTEKALEVALTMLAGAQGKEMITLKARIKLLIAQLKPSQVEKAKEKSLAVIADPKLKARLMFALGDIFDQMSLPDWAIKNYRSGLKLNPKFARGHLRLGEDLETYLKDKAHALQEYQLALELDPKDKETKLRMGSLKKELGLK